MFLTEPSPQYKESFLNGVREFHREGRLLFYDVLRISTNFERFLQQEHAQRERAALAPDRVPFSNFWLIDNGEYIGQVAVRHEMNDFIKRVAGNIGYQIRPSKRRRGYGKAILRLGLQKARELGIPRALLTCDEDNIGSQRVIEYNGGRFED